MKRLFLASALLALLLAGTVVNAQVIHSLTGALSGQLEQAQACARAEHWEEALSRTLAARQVWQDHSFYLYVVTRHGDADRICQSFETAAALLEQRSMGEYLRVSTELRVQLEQLAEAEQPTPANIL